MNRAAMRHLQKPIFQFRRETMRKMNRDVYLTRSMRVLGHGPFRLYAQPLLRNVVSYAELPDKIADAACKGSDKELDRARSGILAAVSHRLIRHDPMLSTENVVTRAAMIQDRKLHASLHAPDMCEQCAASYL